MLPITDDTLPYTFNFPLFLLSFTNGRDTKEKTKKQKTNKIKKNKPTTKEPPQ